MPPHRIGTARALAGALVVLIAGGCSGATGGSREEDAMRNELGLTSSAFEHEGTIPVRCTCDGDDASPPLAWKPGPAGTVSYALVADDPDAPMGTWVHWVAWNITGTELREAVPPSEELPDGMRQGRNSWRRAGYGGPCPPSGTHRYYFRVYALDAAPRLPATTDKAGLLAALEGHVLAEGVLMGRYARGG